MLSVSTRFQLVFFDRSVIKTNWSNINQGPLGRAGMLVRRIAIGSIRRGGKKRKPSPVGSAPRNQSAFRKDGSKRAVAPFKMIYSMPNGKGSVIVGMVGFGGGGQAVPGLHEHSGTAMRKVWAGKLRGRNNRGKTMGPHATKAKALFVRKSVHYGKRPFMVPALRKGRTKMPQLWRRSLN